MRRPVRQALQSSSRAPNTSAAARNRSTHRSSYHSHQPGRYDPIHQPLHQTCQTDAALTPAPGCLAQLAFHQTLERQSPAQHSNTDRRPGSVRRRPVSAPSRKERFLISHHLLAGNVIWGGHSSPQGGQPHRCRRTPPCFLGFTGAAAGGFAAPC